MQGLIPGSSVNRRSKSLKSEFIQIAVLRFPCLHYQFPSGFADGGATGALPETDVLRAHLIKAGAFYSLPVIALRRLRV
jgi:hypothetical protein